MRFLSPCPSTEFSTLIGVIYASQVLALSAVSGYRDLIDRTSLLIFNGMYISVWGLVHVCSCLLDPPLSAGVTRSGELPSVGAEMLRSKPWSSGRGLNC